YRCLVLPVIYRPPRRAQPSRHAGVSSEAQEERMRWRNSVGRIRHEACAGHPRQGTGAAEIGGDVAQQTIERNSRKLAESAQSLEGSADRMEDSADRRTQLAADRTIMAAERTYGAWVRMGLIALASGLGAKAGLAGVVPEWMIVANGSVLVLFSVFCFAAAVWRQLNPGPPPPRPDAPRIHPAILIGVNGVLALVSLAALFGLWFGRTGGP